MQRANENKVKCLHLRMFLANAHVFFFLMSTILNAYFEWITFHTMHIYIEKWIKLNSLLSAQKLQILFEFNKQCPKLNDLFLKMSTDETIFEKVIKFCLWHYEVTRIIWDSKNKLKLSPSPGGILMKYILTIGALFRFRYFHIHESF